MEKQEQTLDKNLIISGKQKTYRNERYQQICKGFIRWCAEQGIPENMGNEIEWLESLSEMGLSARTIRTYAYAVKAYLFDNFDATGLTDDEKILHDYRMEQEFRSFRMPRDVSASHRELVLSRDEVRQILKQSREKTRVIIEFLANTGCRVSEMTGIRLSHVRKKRESEFTIRIIGKRKKQRTLRINGGLRKRIHNAFPDSKVFLFEVNPSQKYTRQGVHDLVKRAGERVGIYGLHPHTFRHYWATTTLERTGKLKAISEYLGHADPATTLIYINSGALTMEDLDQGFYGDRGKKRSKKNA